MLEDQKDAFKNSHKSARENEVLGPITILRIHLAAAMAVACYPCMRFYMEQAKETGITEDEINSVLAIVMAVSSGRVMAQFRDAMKLGEIPKELKPSCIC